MGFLEDRDLNNVPEIPEFYKGKTLFITGASGFMGQTLIEKLLFSCPELDRIYILMRAKKGVKAEDRLAVLYTSLCFERLQKEKPGLFESKVFIVPGDVAESGLGLSDEDRTLLVNRVNIIFHVAASVRFDDPLTTAAKLNLRGTLEVMDFAKDVRDLAVIVHVSTCYAFTNYPYIEEKQYPPLADWRETLEVCDVTDDHTIRVLTNKYLDGMPNTYVFTKQLAEQVVYEQKGKLPIIIIRPSIVISSLEEPFPGWINNFNGPAGIIFACGTGIMRSIYADGDLASDFIPVDTCIKHFIAAAWIRGTKKLEPSDEVEIYNCCSTGILSITFNEICDKGKDIAAKYPTTAIVWYPSFSITASRTYHYLKVMLVQLLPAIFFDFLLWLFGKQTMLVKIQRRIFQANIALRYYTTREWKFNNDNFLQLMLRIKEKDNKEFGYNVGVLDKYKIFVQNTLGGRRCMLKESVEDLPRARVIMFRMKMLHLALKCLFLGYLFWWIWNTKYVQKLIH